ncbi:MAG: class I SAM-dependent methyltransferase [Saprospiraceae bacterium]|nr:class I SAM-dependent methyltransferase [Saprospiraceae bacterium]
MSSYAEKPKEYFKHKRPEMLAFLPSGTRHVLDIGCGEGAFGEEVKKHIQGEIWGIEYVESSAKVAAGIFDHVFSGDVAELLAKVPDNHFDVIYCNDVLEHLTDPYTVLEVLKSKLTKDGVVISSIPNLRYHRALFPLLVKKDFQYEEYGVMDKTHFRFFTGKSIRRMYEELGYEVMSHKGINTTKSVKPFFYNIPLLFTAMDIRHQQYATVAKVKR